MKELKDDDVLRIDNSTLDPIIYLGLKKVAVLIRNSNDRGYILGIYFESKGYTPLTISSLQEGYFKVKHLLEKNGVKCRV